MQPVNCSCWRTEKMQHEQTKDWSETKQVLECFGEE